MMKLIFLGTGAGLPSKERNVSSIALDLQQEINEIWLFDCGEGTQHQLLRTTIKPRKIKKIFITHLHGDHIFGLPGLLSSRSFQGGDEPLTIYGPKGIEAFCKVALKLSQSHLSYPLHFKEFESTGLLLNTDQFEIAIEQLNHGVESFVYKIKEHDQLGSLDVAKLKAMGIEPGPIYQDIKASSEIRLPDGRVIHRKDVVGPGKKGRQVCIFGDTVISPHLKDFIQNSDVIVHEATYLHELKEMAKAHQHSTALEAAKLAKAAQVDTLILTHISSRYQNNQVDLLLKEAQTTFQNTFIAHDFYQFEIK